MIKFFLALIIIVGCCVACFYHIRTRQTSSPTIILITAASGSGKTSILTELSKRVSQESVKIFHFDDIGVPSFDEMIQQYGSPENWQKAMTEKWIEKLSHIKNVPVIFLEGSFNPEFAVNALKKLNIKNYQLFCIHSDRAIREQRLQYLRQQPELITNDMESFAQLLKQKTISLGGIILNNNGCIDDAVRSILQHVPTL